MSNKLLTQKQFAKTIGVSAPYINKLVKKGVVKLKNRKIDPVQAKAAMKLASEPTRKSAVNDIGNDSTKPASSHHQSLIKSKAIREHYRAGLTKLEYEDKAENMVDRRDYDDALLRALAARDIVLKNHILSIPTRCAMKWPDPATRAQIKEMVDIEVREILTEMSKPNLTSIRKEIRTGGA